MHDNKMTFFFGEMREAINKKLKGLYESSLILYTLLTFGACQHHSHVIEYGQGIVMVSNTGLIKTVIIIHAICLGQQ